MRAQLMEREIFISEVANNAKVLNRTINDDDLLRFVVEEVVDRVSLYLRYDLDDKFDPRLVKVVARVASSVFKETNNNADSEEVETAIKSMSDNGQSITYGDATRNYLATVDDGELFGGCSRLLQSFRRIRGVSSKR